jgi:hypothetical protein
MSRETERADLRIVWLVFVPPLALMLLNFWLGTLAESLPDAQPLSAVKALGDGRTPLDDDIGAVMWQASLPVLLTLGAAAVLMGALWLALRRWGWRRVAPWLPRLWLAACVAAGAGLGLNYLNRAWMQALPAQTATVAQARPYPSSERGPGGALTVFTLPGDAAPRRALLVGADPRALPPGRALRLSLARGRFWGEYVTGSNAPAAPRAQ